MPSLWITRGSGLGAHASGEQIRILTEPRYTKEEKKRDKGGGGGG